MPPEPIVWQYPTLFPYPILSYGIPQPDILQSGMIQSGILQPPDLSDWVENEMVTKPNVGYYLPETNNIVPASAKNVQDEYHTIVFPWV